MLLSPQTHSHGYKTWFAFKKTDAYILLIKYKLKSCSMIFWFVFLSRSLRKVFFSLSPCLEGMFSFETNACVCLYVYIFIYFRPISLLWLLILFISHRDVTKSQIPEHLYSLWIQIFSSSLLRCACLNWKKKKGGELHLERIILNLMYCTNNCLPAGTIPYWLQNYGVLLATREFWACR